MNPGSSLAFLSRATLRARRLPLLGALVLALLSFALNHAVALGWLELSLAWGFLPAAGALALLASWIVRGRALTPAALARRLDADWALSSRLETSVELAGENTPLATAQRIDTAEHTARRSPPLTGAWSATLACLALLALLVLSELAVTGLRWRAAQASQSASAAGTVKPGEFSASIRWRSPESEIKATAIEEVPLTAEFTATAAPTSLALEISVNGEPRASRPLPAADLAKLAAGGPRDVALSLYLDELNVQEFDIVAYHLRAGFAGRSAPAASPLQFIQIRPPRDDVMNPGDGAPPRENKLTTTIRELKVAQLQLVKANFQLLHAPEERSDPAWRRDNVMVTDEQRQLAKKSFDLLSDPTLLPIPKLISDNLGGAYLEMGKAADFIAKPDNAAAVNPQNRALALLTATEKMLRRALANQPMPQVQDPFKDAQQYKLPDRKQAPAGQLEELARKQSEISLRLEAGADDQAAAQKQVAADLKALVAAGSLDPAVQAPVARAATDAAEAAQQLAQNDRNAARSPAMSAAEHLAQALAAQEAAGRQNADAGLEAARREIHDADRLADAAARTARLAELARSLRADAEAQQRTGSADAARELAAVSQTVGQAAGQSPGPGSGPGQAAARAQAALAQRRELLARATRQLDRARSSLASPNFGGDPGSLSDAQLGAQLAGALLHAPEETELVRQVATQARQAGSNPGNGAARESLRQSIGRLVAALEKAQASGQRDELVRRFNPDDFDPAYRQAIERYFEQLSRRRTP